VRGKKGEERNLFSGKQNSSVCLCSMITTVDIKIFGVGLKWKTDGFVLWLKLDVTSSCLSIKSFKPYPGFLQAE